MIPVAVVTALGLLAGCGTQPGERAGGGAAAGAATGAGIGALAGPPGALIGAAVGGGAGATTGAVTSPNQVNLGKPPWTNPQTRVDTSQNADVDRLNEQSLKAVRQGQTAY
jgi:hypothetical protein